jgi:hypothetical protein
MNDAGSSAQRIRIGLTGLAFAFLLVLLGSALKPSADEEESAAVTAEQAQAIAAGEEEPDEPLAKLGVAPGAEQAANRADERAAQNATGKNE